MSTPIGQLTERKDILNITNSLPCEVTTDGDHEFSNHSFVRLTGLNGAKFLTKTPAQPHGSDPLNNYKFRIVVTDTDKFTLQDPITFKPIDSTNYTPYIEGGSCNLVQNTYIYYPSAEQEFPN